MRLKKGNVERVAETAEQIEKLKRSGFEETGGAAAGRVPDDTPPMDLGRLTVAQLRELAQEKGLEGCGSLSKAELIAILKDVA